MNMAKMLKSIEQYREVQSFNNLAEVRNAVAWTIDVHYAQLPELATKLGDTCLRLNKAQELSGPTTCITLANQIEGYIREIWAQ